MSVETLTQWWCKLKSQEDQKMCSVGNMNVWTKLKPSQYLERHFSPNQTFWPAGGTRWKVRGSAKDSSSGDHESLNQIPWKSIQYLLRYFTLDQSFRLICQAFEIPPKYKGDEWGGVMSSYQPQHGNGMVSFQRPPPLVSLLFGQK